MGKKKFFVICSIAVLLILFGFSVLTLRNTKTREAHDSKAAENPSCDKAILSIEGRKMVIAPPNYDGDSRELFEKELMSVELAENVDCSSLSIETRVDANGKKTSSETFSELTLEDLKMMLEDCFLCGHLWFNENGEVRAIRLYGETIYYE